MSGDSAGEGGAARAVIVVRGMPRRALALIVSLAVVGMLGIGWLVDGLPTTPMTATQDTLSEQVGLTTVTLISNPSPVHPNQPASFILHVTDVAGARVAGAKAQCSFSMPAMGMVLPSVVATSSAQPGEYVCGPQSLEMGVWALVVTLTLPNGAAGHATFHLNVA